MGGLIKNPGDLNGLILLCNLFSENILLNVCKRRRRKFCSQVPVDQLDRFFFFFFFYHVVFAFPEKSVLPLLDFSVLILTFSVKL